MEGAVQGYTEREATARACNGRGYDQARHAGHCYRVPTESHRHVCAQLVCNSLMPEFDVQFRDDSPACEISCIVSFSSSASVLAAAAAAANAVISEV